MIASSPETARVDPPSLDAEAGARTSQAQAATVRGVLSSSYDELTVGTTFTTRGRTVTESDLASFAGLTWDIHPQHTDAEFARRSTFGERIAHGMMVVSFALGLVPFDPARIVALRGLEQVVFKAPVRIGDTLSAFGRIARLTRIDAELGLVGCDLRIANQAGAAVARARVSVIWRAGVDDGDGRGQT